MLYTKLAAPISLALLLIVALHAQENKLNTDETEAGYDLLFNGTDLSNWHAYRTTAVTDAWTVKTNTPLGPRIENGNGNKQPILTNKKYTNFDVKIDVQVPADGNSGIFTRYEEVATQSGNARSGPELQICGPNHEDCVGTTKHLGSCYDMFGVKESIRSSWAKPAGQWNQIRIIAFDSNYVHYGNGKKLLEYKIGTIDYLKAYNESKYVSDGNNGRYYHIHPGGILLQHHGEIGVTFRNVKAKELAVHPFKKEFLDGKWPETLDHAYALGKTGTGLSVERSDAEDAFAIRVMDAGRHGLRLEAPFDHAGFHVVGLDGRALPWTREGDAYLVRRSEGAPGLAVVRLNAGGSVRSRLVSLP